MAKIAVADDHVLMRMGLARLLTEQGHHVIFQADNGQQVQEMIDENNLPQVILMDVNMPVLDGHATTLWLKAHHPSVKVLVLSMIDDDRAIIRMIRAGAKGYILKDCHPTQLTTAIDALILRGVYSSDLVSSTLMQSLTHGESDSTMIAGLLSQLSDREKEFLRLACTEMTYKDIAERMFVSPRTVEDYRDELYRKCGIRSRVGLVLFAVRQGIIHV